MLILAFSLKLYFLQGMSGPPLKSIFPRSDLFMISSLKFSILTTILAFILVGCGTAENAESDLKADAGKKNEYVLQIVVLDGLGDQINKTVASFADSKRYSPSFTISLESTDDAGTASEGKTECSFYAKKLFIEDGFHFSVNSPKTIINRNFAVKRGSEGESSYILQFTFISNKGDIEISCNTQDRNLYESLATWNPSKTIKPFRFGPYFVLNSAKRFVADESGSVRGFAEVVSRKVKPARKALRGDGKERQCKVYTKDVGDPYLEKPVVLVKTWQECYERALSFVNGSKNLEYVGWLYDDAFGPLYNTTGYVNEFTTKYSPKPTRGNQAFTHLGYHLYIEKLGAAVEDLRACAVVINKISKSSSGTRSSLIPDVLVADWKECNLYARKHVALIESDEYLTWIYQGGYLPFLTTNGYINRNSDIYAPTPGKGNQVYNDEGQKYDL